MTRISVRRGGLIAGAMTLVAVLGGVAIAGRGAESCLTPADANGGAGDRPNIVLILTDDQRWDTLAAMPNVQRLLVRPGVTFSNAFVDDPLCCPSRSSILTGKYVHSTGVWQNAPPKGGFPAFDDRSTIATWLHAAGYRTALVGKYLNRYESSYVPPGWDRWVAFDGSASRYALYYRYVLNVDGRPEVHGGGPGDYSTTVLTRHAVDFICGTRGPLFLSFDPYGPHWPYTPAPGDRYAGPIPPSAPSYDEADVTDKPGWIREIPRFTPERNADVHEIRRDTYDTLVSLDRSVGEVVDALSRTGRLGNTLIVFTSDNGINWGEHRWVDKVAPYEESIRVPMVVRFDPVVGAHAGTVDPRLVVNIDLAPTFADAAGVASPGAEGRSILPLVSGDPVRWRADFAIEHMEDIGVPSYCGVRSTRYAYVAYGTGEEELYDLRHDPYELANLAGRPRAAGVLLRLRERARTLCDPQPPGFPGIPGLPSG
jgi:arylsulfatase A-like enzyme